MKRFKNILLIFERDAKGKAALERAVNLAKDNQARLTVVEVIGELPADARRMISVWRPPLLDDPQELVVRERQEQLAQLTDPVREQGIQVTAEVLVGNPFLEITRQVLGKNHDLVIMTAEGTGGLKEWLFGSTSMHLMRKCPCPIWVVKGTQRERYARILAAVDTDPDDSSKDALNTKIMDLATSLAQLEKSKLHVVHAWRVLGETLSRSGRGALPHDQFERWLRETESAHRKQMAQLLGKYALENLNQQVHLLKGKAASVIPSLAQEKQVDLIVMGTVCRTGIAGFFIGNTAEEILRQVDCSVLTVKPEGFVSPVILEGHRRRKCMEYGKHPRPDTHEEGGS